MRLVLLLLVLGGCRSAPPVAVSNRGGTARSSCGFPPRIEREARRYANLDRSRLDTGTWSSWRIGLQLKRAADQVRGTLAMVGDELTWTFDVAGTLDLATCQLALSTDSHEPFAIELARSETGEITGRIRSADDVWFVGPPFSMHRP